MEKERFMTAYSSGTPAPTKDHILARVEQDIPVNHSEFFAPVIEPTLSNGTQALVIAALTYLVK